MNLNKVYNDYIRRLNALDGDQDIKLYDEVSDKDIIKIGDIEFIENHYHKVNERYKQLQLGIYSN